LTRRVHAESRSIFGLPPEPPGDVTGVRCRPCANECSIPEGGMGYCGEVEVSQGLSLVWIRDIPYSLLAFYPQFYMNLPTTSKKEAIECMGAAKKYLKRVRIGNIHLLS